jgi:hypothetical protein
VRDQTSCMIHLTCTWHEGHGRTREVRQEGLQLSTRASEEPRASHSKDPPFLQAPIFIQKKEK